MLPAIADKKRLFKALSTLPEKTILVAGDFMLDQYIRGSVSRISPEAPVPVVVVSSESFVPGGAGNVAFNLASLGARVKTLGLTGDDIAGQGLRERLSTKGIELSDLLCDSSRMTSQKCRVIAERQQVVRFDRENSAVLTPETENLLLSRINHAVASSDAVIISDYGKGVLTKKILNELIRSAQKARIPVTVDPKIEHFKSYRGVTCLTPNLQEAALGLGRPLIKSTGAVETLGRDILKTLKCRSLLITRGADGMSLFLPSKPVIHIPTQAREVYDVSGAGDTVISVLTLALAGGCDIVTAACLANISAGIVVGKLGTAATSIKEIKEAIS